MKIKTAAMQFNDITWCEGQHIRVDPILKKFGNKAATWHGSVYGYPKLPQKNLGR